MNHTFNMKELNFIVISLSKTPISCASVDVIIWFLEGDDKELFMMFNIWKAAISEQEMTLNQMSEKLTKYSKVLFMLHFALRNITAQECCLKDQWDRVDVLQY